MPEIVLHPVVDSLQDVPEAFRGSYSQTDGGKFALSKPITVDDQKELRGALQREREGRRTLEAKLHEIPSDAAERLQRAEKLEQEALIRSGDMDKVIASLETKFKGELQRRDEYITKLKSTASDSLATTLATDALNEMGGSVRGLLPHVLPQLRTVEKAPGQFEVIVFDPDSPDRPRLGRNGKAMTVVDVIETLKSDDVLSRLFDGSSSPSGAKRGFPPYRSGSGRVVQLDASQAKDPKLYAKLKEDKAAGRIDGAVLPDGRRLV